MSTHVVEHAFPTTKPIRHRTFRSVGAVLSGIVATFVVTTAVDLALHAAGIFPPVGVWMADSLFFLALAYRIPFNIVGSYVAARLAPTRPLRHAISLGIAGTVIATAGAVGFWSAGPAWYSLANIAIALPCGWLGGTIFHSAIRSARSSCRSRIAMCKQTVAHRAGR